MSDTTERDEAVTPQYRSVEELESRQTEIKGQLEDIVQETTGRQTTDAEKARWNSLNEELDELTAIAAEMDAMRSRMEQIKSQPQGGESARFNVARQRATSDIYDLWAARQAARGPQDEARLLRDNAMRAIERSSFAHPDIDNDVARAHVERLMQRFESLDDDTPMSIDGGQSAAFARHILQTGSPQYRRAFGKTLMGRPLNPDEQRALSTTTTAGGFAVPYTLDPTIIPTSNSSVNPYRAIARVETINTSTWQGVTSAGVTATRRTEAAQTADGAPTLAQPTATPSRVDTFVPYSIEIGQDWGRLESEIAQAIQDAKDDEEATAFTTGNGVAPNPQGIVSGATTVVTGATSATFAIADLFSVYNALPPRFKPRAVWVANEAIWNLVRQFATASGPSALVDSLQPGLGGTGVPTSGEVNARLLGRAAYEASAMKATTATGDLIAVFGDFRYFLIVDRIGMTVDLIPHLFGTQQMPTGQRGIFAYWRNTSTVLSANAFRVLKVK